MDHESGHLVRLVGAVLGLRSRIDRRCGGFRARKGRHRLRRSGRIFPRRTHCHCRTKGVSFDCIRTGGICLIEIHNLTNAEKGKGRAYGFLSGWYFLLRRR